MADPLPRYYMLPYNPLAIRDRVTGSVYRTRSIEDATALTERLNHYLSETTTHA